VRGGERVELAARPVTIDSFELLAMRPGDDMLDLDVIVVCSSGTYVRALARDLGGGFGVGGHLTALRRTRVGPYRIEAARTIEQLEAEFAAIPLPEAVAGAFPIRWWTRTRRGGCPRCPAGRGRHRRHVRGIRPDGGFLALLEDAGELAKPIAVFASA
jgi:tRNA pseudouridine55 synthase